MATPARAGSTRSEPAGKIRTGSCQAGEITRRLREQEGLASAGQTSSPCGLVHSPLPSAERQHRLAAALISPSGLVQAGVSPPRAVPLLRKHSPHLSERHNAALRPRRTGSGSNVRITHGHLPREGAITAPTESRSVAECGIKHQHSMGRGRACKVGPASMPRSPGFETVRAPRGRSPHGDPCLLELFSLPV